MQLKPTVRSICDLDLPFKKSHLNFAYINHYHTSRFWYPPDYNIKIKLAAPGKSYLFLIEAGWWEELAPGVGPRVPAASFSGPVNS